MTGNAAGDNTEELVTPAQRIRPESIPEPPEVDDGASAIWSTAPAPLPRRIRPPKPTRRPALGLPLLVLFALAATFFSWVSAEPFWLAVGHGDRGTLTVTDCAGGGLSARCEGKFSTMAYTADGVALSGAADGHRTGENLTARMVSGHATSAYAGNAAGLHLRWAIGFGLVLLCAVGIAWATGALRFRGRGRYGALALSVGGPLALLAAMLALTF